MIEVRCSCGQIYHADPAHAGRTIRCRCGNMLSITAPRIVEPRPSRRATGQPPPPSRSTSPRRQGAKWGGRARGSDKARRVVGVLVWAYLGAVFAYTGLLWLWGDDVWFATALLFGPRWPALVPALPLVLAALLIRLPPRRLIPLGAAVLIALGPGMGYRIGWRAWLTPAAEPRTRIITFNVDGDVNPQLLTVPADLEEFQPDIMVFQECSDRLVSPLYWPAGWTARFDDGFCLGTHFQLAEMRSLERVATGELGGTGNAVLYRLVAPPPGDTVDLVVVHLETPRKGLEPLRYGGDLSRLSPSTFVREVGSRRISRWTHAQSRNAIIAGDFNMPVESVIYHRYWADCLNAFSQVGHGFGGTRVLRWFSTRIDHVLTCRGWRPVRAFLGPDLGSDHLPLIVDLIREK